MLIIVLIIMLIIIILIMFIIMLVMLIIMLTMIIMLIMLIMLFIIIIVFIILIMIIMFIIMHFMMTDDDGGDGDSDHVCTDDFFSWFHAFSCAFSVCVVLFFVLFCIHRFYLEASLLSCELRPRN